MTTPDTPSQTESKEIRLYQLTLTEDELTCLAALFLLLNPGTTMLGRMTLLVNKPHLTSLADKADLAARSSDVYKRVMGDPDAP